MCLAHCAGCRKAGLVPPIAGIAAGATKGFAYTGSEYPHAVASFGATPPIVRREALLGGCGLGSDYQLAHRVMVNAGASWCRIGAGPRSADTGTRAGDDARMKDFDWR